MNNDSLRRGGSRLTAKRLVHQDIRLLGPNIGNITDRGLKLDIEALHLHRG